MSHSYDSIESLEFPARNPSLPESIRRCSQPRLTSQALLSSSELCSYIETSCSCCGEYGRHDHIADTPFTCATHNVLKKRFSHPRSDLCEDISTYFSHSNSHRQPRRFLRNVMLSPQESHIALPVKPGVTLPYAKPRPSLFDSDLILSNNNNNNDNALLGESHHNALNRDAQWVKNPDKWARKRYLPVSYDEVMELEERTIKAESLSGELRASIKLLETNMEFSMTRLNEMLTREKDRNLLIETKNIELIKEKEILIHKSKLLMDQIEKSKDWGIWKTQAQVLQDNLHDTQQKLDYYEDRCRNLSLFWSAKETEWELRLNDKQAQLDEWKAKISTQEMDYKHLLQTLQEKDVQLNQMQINNIDRIHEVVNERVTYLDKRYQSLKASLTNKCEELKESIQQLNTELEEKNKECGKLHEALRDASDTAVKKEKELMFVKMELTQVREESRNQKRNHANLQKLEATMNQDYLKKQADVETLQHTIFVLTEEKNQLKNQLHCKKYEEAHHQDLTKIKENEFLKQQKILEIKRANADAKTDKQKHENEELVDQMSRFQSAAQRKTQSLTKQVNALTNEMKNLNDTNSTALADLQTQLKLQEEDHNREKARLSGLCEEKERKTNVLEKQLEALKQSLSEGEAKYSEAIHQFTEQFKVAEEEKSKVANDLAKLQTSKAREIDLLKEQLQVLRGTSSEAEHLYSKKLSELSEQHESEKKKNQVLKNELDNLQQMKKNEMDALREEVTELKQKYEESCKANARIRDENKDVLEEMLADVQRDKQHEMDVLKGKLQELHAKLKEKGARQDVLDQTKNIDNINPKDEQQRAILPSASHVHVEKESEIEKLQKQLETLQKKGTEQKNQDADVLKLKQEIDMYKHENQALQAELAKTLSDNDVKTSKMAKEIATLQEVIEKQSEELKKAQDMEAQIKEFEKKNDHLSQDLKAIQATKDAEIKKLNEKINTLVEESHSTINNSSSQTSIQIEKLQVENAILTHKLNDIESQKAASDDDLRQEIERLEHILQGKEGEIAIKTNAIEGYKEEIEHLKKSIDQLDVELKRVTERVGHPVEIPILSKKSHEIQTPVLSKNLPSRETEKAPPQEAKQNSLEPFPAVSYLAALLRGDDVAQISSLHQRNNNVLLHTDAPQNINDANGIYENLPQDSRTQDGADDVDTRGHSVDRQTQLKEDENNISKTTIKHTPPHKKDSLESALGTKKSSTESKSTPVIVKKSNEIQGNQPKRCSCRKKYTVMLANEDEHVKQNDSLKRTMAKEKKKLSKPERTKIPSQHKKKKFAKGTPHKSDHLSSRTSSTENEHPAVPGIEHGRAADEVQEAGPLRSVSERRDKENVHVSKLSSLEQSPSTKKNVLSLSEGSKTNPDRIKQEDRMNSNALVKKATSPSAVEVNDSIRNNIFALPEYFKGNILHGFQALAFHAENELMTQETAIATETPMNILSSNDRSITKNDETPKLPYSEDNADILANPKTASTEQVDAIEPRSYFRPSQWFQMWN